MPSIAANRHGMLDASGLQQPREVTENWKTMGTELLIIGVSVLLFGLCALFVRICDRV